MKRMTLAVAVFLLFAPLAWAQAGQNAEIDKVRSAYEKAAEAGNIQDLLGLYTADAVIMPPEMPMVMGKTQIEAFHKKMFDSATLSNVKIAPTHTEAMGDTAIDVGTYSQTVTPKGGQGMTEKGKYVVVLRKQSDGSWKLAYEIFNTDEPVTKPSTAGR